MKKFLLKFSSVCAILIVFCSTNCFAQRSISQMAEIAKSKLNCNVEIVASAGKSAHERVVRKVRSASAPTDLFYVFNGEKKGFAIVATDEHSPAILGYSDEGTFDPNNIPDGLVSMLELYHDQLTMLKSKPNLETASIKKTYTPIAPMLKCHFYQAEPYNNLCPTIGGQRTVTGCVACGLAQVLYFWQAPKDSLKGTIEYGGNRTAFDNPDDFPYEYKLSGHVFDWKNILPRYVEGQYTPEQAYAVADLSLICGIATDMEYGVKSSGTNLFSITKRLVDNFGMSDKCSLLRSIACTWSEWQQFVVTELQAGRPIYYVGQIPTDITNGHCFNLDGMDSNGLIHINWGWDGRSDGYFLLNVLNPKDQGIGGSGMGEGYGAWNEMVYGLCPKGMDEDIPYLFRLTGYAMFFFDPVAQSQTYAQTINNTPASYDTEKSKQLNIIIQFHNYSRDFTGVLNAEIHPSANPGTPVKVFQIQDTIPSSQKLDYTRTFKLDFSTIPTGSYKVTFSSQDKRESVKQPLNFERGFADTLYLQITDSGYIISKEKMVCPIKCEFLNNPTTIHLLEGLDTIKTKIICRPDMDLTNKRLALYTVGLNTKNPYTKATTAFYYNQERGTEGAAAYFIAEPLGAVNSQMTKADNRLQPGDVLGMFIKSSCYDMVCSDTVKITILDSEIPAGKQPMELTINGTQENYNVGDTIHYTLHKKGNTFITRIITPVLKDGKGTAHSKAQNFRINVTPDTDTDEYHIVPTKGLAEGTYTLYLIDILAQKGYSSEYDIISNQVQLTIGSPTGISNIIEGNNEQKHAEGIFNLAGQRVNADYKGIIIVNGKKVLNK